MLLGEISYSDVFKKLIERGRKLNHSFRLELTWFFEFHNENVCFIYVPNSDQYHDQFSIL